MCDANGDAVSGEDFADDLRQVAIIFDDEDSRLVTQSAKGARQLGKQRLFLWRLGRGLLCSS